MIDRTLQELGNRFSLDKLVAVGHRLVHGGDTFSGGAELTPEVMAKIRDLSELAPLHQPQAIRLIEVILDLHPRLFQTASFDTTFHTVQDDLVRRFAIPRQFHDLGIKRYGFHGLSYQYVAGALARRVPQIAKGKIIVAHLGSGASLCAMENGQSCDTSMGFSALDGIPMATRPGGLDPGVLLHLMGPLGKSVGEVEDMLYHRSGLLGVSGVSGDIRELFESNAAEAHEAIDLFTLRIAGEVGRLTSTMEGLDALVFTAGVGENQPRLRARVMKRLEWLGVETDPAANENSALKISASASRIAVYIIPTDEEQVIAEDCLANLNSQL